MHSCGAFAADVEHGDVCRSSLAQRVQYPHDIVYLRPIAQFVTTATQLDR
jgi:hypothetical protein